MPNSPTDFVVHGDHAVYPNGFNRKLSPGERARHTAHEFVARTSGQVPRPMEKENEAEIIDGVEVIIHDVTLRQDPDVKAMSSDPNLAGQSELFDELPKQNASAEVKKERTFFDIPAIKSHAKMSNDILRSGLFSVRERKLGQEETVKDRPIATFSNASMTFSGVLLDQQDYRVYEVLIQEYKESGCTIQNKLTDILRTMNLPDNSQYRDSVFETLKRLRQATIFIQAPGYKYVGGLVNGVILNEKTDEIQITLGPELAVMFARNNWTWLDRSHRAKLGKNHLASWLFNFASTHEHMFPISRQELKRLSESTQPQKKFNQKLKLAIELINSELGEFGWRCELVGELLKIHRKATRKEQETVFI